MLIGKEALVAIAGMGFQRGIIESVQSHNNNVQASKGALVSKGPDHNQAL
jgi:hypothetical protein